MLLSILFWASVHVALSVGYAAVISEWTLDFFRKFLIPLHIVKFRGFTVTNFHSGC